MHGSRLRVEQDDVNPHDYFVQLTSPGHSRLQLTCGPVPDNPRPPGPPASLALSLQKGLRNAMPHAGEAGIDVFVDGTLVTSVRDVGVDTREIQLPADHIEPDGEHTIELRLREDATTTVWVYEVRLR